MLVICEECGKQYEVDPSQIKGREVKAICKACGRLITVSQSEVETPDAIPLIQPIPESAGTPDAAKTGRPAKGMPRTGRRRFGLSGKMLTLFLIIPVIIIAVSGALYLWQFQALSSLHIDIGSKMITQMAKYLITEKARAVAKQCKVYLESHPTLRKEDFPSDVELKGLAMAEVGQTGYTFLYSVAGDGEPMTLWLHPDEKLHGAPLSAVMRESLGNEFNRFTRIVKYAEEGKNIESEGFYLQKDEKGRLREKYIFIAPVEGTSYGIAATTYLDEFTRLIKVMEARSKKMSGGVRNVIIGTVGATLLLIGIIVFLYAQKLTRRIKSLTALADRISVGELDTVIDIKSRDEIEDLSHAISRMQASIKVSIERLRRRR